MSTTKLGYIFNKGEIDMLCSVLGEETLVRGPPVFASPSRHVKGHGP